LALAISRTVTHPVRIRLPFCQELIPGILLGFP
jgi:hypothetical protein